MADVGSIPPEFPGGEILATVRASSSVGDWLRDASTRTPLGEARGDSRAWTSGVDEARLLAGRRDSLLYRVCLCRRSPTEPLLRCLQDSGPPLPRPHRRRRRSRVTARPMYA